jgi:hypothetical protein
MIKYLIEPRRPSESCPETSEFASVCEAIHFPHSVDCRAPQGLADSDTTVLDPSFHWGDVFWGVQGALNQIFKTFHLKIIVYFNSQVIKSYLNMNRCHHQV